MFSVYKYYVYVGMCALRIQQNMINIVNWYINLYRFITINHDLCFISNSTPPLSFGNKLQSLFLNILI